MSGGRNTRRAGFLVVGLMVSLFLAGVVSAFAVDTPDGLEYTALKGCVLNEDHEPVEGVCMAQAEEDHPLADSLLADYGWRGVDNDLVANGLAGVVGVLLTFAVGGGLFWLLRRRRPAATDAPAGTGQAAE